LDDKVNIYIKRNIDRRGYSHKNILAKTRERIEYNLEGNIIETIVFSIQFLLFNKFLIVILLKHVFF